LSGDWNWDPHKCGATSWDGNSLTANPLSAYCILTKDSVLQAAEDQVNNKHGQCPSASPLGIDQPLVSNAITATSYRHVEDIRAGTDDGPAIVTMVSEGGF